ncbi:MAG: HAMP domain-containing sensor histidine kinase [Candidatus Solibacter sp.]
MRSIHVKMLLWSFVTLALALVAFYGISRLVSSRAAAHLTFFEDLSWEVEQARQTYELGGVPELARYMEHVQKTAVGRRYLTDSQGIDLVTGEDRSAALALARLPDGAPGKHTQRAPFLVTTTNDGLYCWIVELIQPGPAISDYIPYYLLVLAAVGSLGWLLAMNFASPVRMLARTVDRFGEGDLAARANFTRRDEIGDLARAFDRMAQRTGTLLTAERRLLQDVSHEIRTPLARLTFAAELLRTADDRDAAVALVKKEIQRLGDLVGTLVEVTRAEGDPEAVLLEEMRLDCLLTEVVHGCQMEADRVGCSIALRAEVPLVIVADRELLRRAYENVLRNAVRYAPPGSAVEAKLEVSAETAAVTVRDYGPGVPAEDLPRIFTPFFRVDRSRDSSTGGIGLGLAIAARAVELHKGRIRAENAGPGLRISIELDIAAAGQTRLG